MRWLQTEYILKGLYLGMLLDLAVLVGQRKSDESAGNLILIQIGCLLGGVLLALLVAAGIKLSQGYRVSGRVGAFALFLLLESPTLVYAGVLAGTLAAVLLVHEAVGKVNPATDLKIPIYLLASGALLGVAFGGLHEVQDSRRRLMYSLAMAIILLLGAGYAFGLLFTDDPGANPPVQIERTGFALALLLGLPGFYLLTFVGKEEESEVEIGALCAGVCLCLGLAAFDVLKSQFGLIIIALPVLLYFWYTIRVLPGLRVFKHALRGYGHFRVGRYRLALISFRQALHHDPNNELAREGFWQVHINLDLAKLADDPLLLAQVDFGLCLQRAGSLLLEPNPPPARLEEAQRLLNLVVSQRPEMRPGADYWRVVALVHMQQIDEAGDLLGRLLDPTIERPLSVQQHRQNALLQAWQLALLLHPVLRERVGKIQLALPGRRMEAIAAVERHLAETPGDPNIIPLKRLLYHDLGEDEYKAAAVADQVVPNFDYAYVEQLGMALISDDERWERGGLFLRIAAHGQPMKGPTLFVQIAQALQKAGMQEQALHNFEVAKRSGQALGQKDLAEPERIAYFQTLKYLGEVAMQRGDIDAAIEDFRLYAEWERSGVPTLRMLADLYEQRGDALAALRIVERALVFDAQDPDLQVRKDKYYYSVDPEVVRANVEAIKGSFDVEYCMRKAKSALDTSSVDLEMLDWAEHLLKLVQVLKPEGLVAKTSLARVRARRGEVEEAVQMLEQVHNPKPEKFASAEDEEAWYQSCQVLGELYLNNLGRADLAIPCLNEFRQSNRSGARTWLRLGQAYEQVGDRARAVKCYSQVTAYEGNPLAWEARDALSRLGAPTA